MSSKLVQRRLEAILRALPRTELVALTGRMGIVLDPKKRIDEPAQAARALVRQPDLREPSRLQPASVELLHRIAEAGGSLITGSLPGGLEQLVSRGLVYAGILEPGGGSGTCYELMLPTAFLIQLKSWESEDPRSIRALLAESPFETVSAIASYYLGRPSTPPIYLSLEPAWEVLGDPESLRREIGKCSHQERRLLDSLEQVGGEVDMQELMDLEREPMRVRPAYGVATGRRGVAFALEKRGLLFPVPPSRYVIPTEVAAIIGFDRRKEREKRRREIRRYVIAEDHLPRRAKFSSPPGPLALALALALREQPTEVRSGIGTPRTLVSRKAHRLGRSVGTTALIIALSRAVGLWEAGAVSAASPPGSLTIGELSSLLFDTWRRGGAWDEARPEAEVLRLAPEHRDPSPAGVLRDMLLHALLDLGEGQWAPCSAIIAYLQNDPRTGGVKRLFSRWADRVGLTEVWTLDRIARRMLLESLPSLGVVDLGGEADASLGSGEIASLAVRLTSRGRAYIAASNRLEPRSATPPTLQASELSEPRALKVGDSARVADVLKLVGFVEMGAIDSTIELRLSPAAIARGLAAGIDASTMGSRISAIAPLSSELQQALREADTIVGRATLTPTAGFLWVEDAEVRELLRTRPPAAELFVDPSPPAGLLIAPGVDPQRLTRRCRVLGVTIEVEQHTIRARAESPVPTRSGSRRTMSWRPAHTPPAPDPDDDEPPSS